MSSQIDFESRIKKINKMNQLYEELIDKPSPKEGYDIIQSLFISAMSFCLATQPTEEYDKYLNPEYSSQEENNKKNYTFKFKNYKVVFNLIETCDDGYCLLNALLGIRKEYHQTREIKEKGINDFVKKYGDVVYDKNKKNWFHRQALDLFCLEYNFSYIYINKNHNKLEYFLNPLTRDFSYLRIIIHNGANHYEEIDWDIFSVLDSKETIINKKNTKRNFFYPYSKQKNDYILNILERYKKPEELELDVPYFYHPFITLSDDDRFDLFIKKEIKKKVGVDKIIGISIKEYFDVYSNFGYNEQKNVDKNFDTVKKRLTY